MMALFLLLGILMFVMYLSKEYGPYIYVGLMGLGFTSVVTAQLLGG